MKIHVNFENIAFEAAEVNLINWSIAIKLVYIGLVLKQPYTISKCL